MFITNHVLAGAAIGLTARRRLASTAIAGVASHFVLDSIPHWGTPDKRVFRRVAVIDGLCGLATMAIVVRAVPKRSRITVLAGMLGAALPDADKPAEMFFNWAPFPAPVNQFHNAIQSESRHGLLNEARAAVILCAWVASLSGRRRREA